MPKKERYATIGTWVKVFREEGNPISNVTIAKRLRKAKVIGETARTRVGRVVRGGFYAESEVRKLCADLLQKLPRANEDGTFELGGETYGTTRSLSKLFGISEPTIKRKLQKSTLTATKGKTKRGRLRDFYPLSEVRKLCGNLLQELPQTNDDGTFERGGKTYGSIESLSRILGVSINPISARLQKSSLVPIKGKNKGGRICNFYPLSEVRKLCSDILQKLPRANEDGTFELGGETYGTIYSLSRLLIVSHRSIRLRLQKSSTVPLKGKTTSGQLYDFYPLSEIRELFADLLQELPQTNEDGTFKIDGETYGTARSLSRILGVSHPTISSRLKRSPLTSIKGRDNSRHICDFYSLSEIRKLCADLIAKKSKKKR